MKMRTLTLAAAILAIGIGTATAQTAPANVDKVITTETNFDKLVAKKGIKDGFLEVADPEGIVFKPNAVKITDFYSSIEKQAGNLRWEPKFARISAAGDLAFTAGPYVYQNGKTDDDKVFGDYVSIWRADSEGKLKLLIDLGIQHPEPEQQETTDFKSPDPNQKVLITKDFLHAKQLITNTDANFNHSLSIYALGAYKEFLSSEGRFYFPGFEPMAGQDKILRFLESEAINISAETVNAGRSTSGDLAYTYGRARIKKGTIVFNANYVRVWEQDKDHKWNILLEVFSSIEN